MAYPRERLSRVLGYQPIRISAGVKRAIWSSLLAIPLAMTATGISDSTAVSDGVRYVVAPGTMLAVRVVRVEPSHRGLDRCLSRCLALVRDSDVVCSSAEYDLLCSVHLLDGNYHLRTQAEKRLAIVGEKSPFTPTTKHLVATPRKCALVLRPAFRTALSNTILPERGTS